MVRTKWPYIVEVKLLVSGRVDQIFHGAYDDPQKQYQKIFDTALMSWLEDGLITKSLGEWYPAFVDACDDLSPEDIREELQKNASCEGTTVQNPNPSTNVPDRNTVVQTLEQVTDHLSLCLRDKAFGMFLMDNVVIMRVLNDIQQTLVELKGSLQWPEDTVKITIPEDDDQK